jgi:hypothetical protein
LGHLAWRWRARALTGQIASKQQAGKQGEAKNLNTANANAMAESAA